MNRLSIFALQIVLTLSLAGLASAALYAVTDFATRSVVV
jgi:hypothetical protein